MSYAQCNWSVTVFNRQRKHGCDVTTCFPVLFYKRNRKWTPCLVFASGYINMGGHFLFLNIISKDLTLNYCKCCNLIGYAICWVFQKKNTMLWNNFEEITNTSLFLLKQLDYLLSISIIYLSLLYTCIYSI